MTIPFEAHYPGHVHPYTTATALTSGWLREIPLLDRRSLQHFYASEHLSDDAAAAVLCDLAGADAACLDGPAVPQRTRHRQVAWAGNCIAVGAAAGDIEPLESTSLYLLHHGAAMLAEHFPLGEALEPLAFRYNRIMTNRFYELLDFASLHYCLSQRDDTDFWQDARKPSRIPDRLAAKLDFWRLKQPTPADFEDQRLPGQGDPATGGSAGSADPRDPVDTGGLWTHENYQAVLYGMDFPGQQCERWPGAERPATSVPPHIAARVAEAPAKLPPHAVWLQKVLGMPHYSPR
jgi:tryptophan halogenase